MEISQAIDIPLKLSGEAHTIKSYDYQNIIKFINNACCSVENTPRSFEFLGEEALRDVILSNLNTHYLPIATGETFRKAGKIGIHIQFENKSVYIAECKLWHEKSNFLIL